MLWPKKKAKENSSHAKSDSGYRALHKKPGFLLAERAVKTQLAKDQERNTKEESYWAQQNKIARRAVIISAFALGFLVITGVVAGLAYLETKRQANAAEDQVVVAKDAEYYQSRANIILSDITTADSPDALEIGLIPKWENTGNVAANVRASISYHFWEDNPPDYFFLNEGTRFDFTLGPKEASSAIFSFLPKGCIDDVLNARRFKFVGVWGVARYVDSLSSKVRTTRFCWNLMDSFSQKNLASERLRHEYCIPGNCADNACKVVYDGIKPSPVVIQPCGVITPRVLSWPGEQSPK